MEDIAMTHFKLSPRTKSNVSKRRHVRPQVEELEDRSARSTLVALTPQDNLLTFDSAAPGTVITSADVSGLQVGERLLGIDVRPATGQVYGLTSAARLYTLNPFTGAA